MLVQVSVAALQHELISQTAPQHGWPTPPQAAQTPNAQRNTQSVQHVPFGHDAQSPFRQYMQSGSPGHFPHNPPQPSPPQTLPLQLGLHFVLRFFLRRLRLASASTNPKSGARAPARTT
jgi:hypothetical protein